MGYTQVNVKEAQYEELQKLRERYNASYIAIIDEMLEFADEIEPEGNGYNRHAGRTSEGECLKEVSKLLERHTQDNEMREAAIEGVQVAFDQRKLLKKQPTSIASGAEYFAKVLKNKPSTQKEIADKYDVSKVTLRNVYKEIANAIQEP
jgi:hypothetical protein